MPPPFSVILKKLVVELLYVDIHLIVQNAHGSSRIRVNCRKQFHRRRHPFQHAQLSRPRRVVKNQSTTISSTSATSIIPASMWNIAPPFGVFPSRSSLHDGQQQQGPSSGRRITLPDPDDSYRTIRTPNPREDWVSCDRCMPAHPRL